MGVFKYLHFPAPMEIYTEQASKGILNGEALAIFERGLIIHFQQISKAAALYERALLGRIKRALEKYRRVDDSTNNYP